MNPSKGLRREVKVRLPVALVEGLERERDARHLAGTLRPIDGLPALVEEAVALRHDRDAEMDRIRGLVVDLEARLAAAIRLAKDKAREARRAKADRRTRGQVRSQAALPAQEPDLEALPGKVACGPCGGPRTALDDALGLVDCSQCRARRLPP